MRKNLVVLGICGLVMLGNVSKAQLTHKCGNEQLQTQVDSDPILKAAFDKYYDDVVANNKAYVQKAATSANKTTAAVSIPVVFHIILTQTEINQLGGIAGIYDRVTTNIAVLNEDYNAKNLNQNSIPTVFKSVVGTADINFGLAHRAPDGSGTIGIEIKVAPNGFAGFGVGDPKAKRDNGGGLNPWDNTKYLNIWVVNLTSSGTAGAVLGYGYSPSYATTVVGSAIDAGVVIHYGALGRRTSPSQYFFGNNVDKGRTLTHEIGHFFNIFHIWGNTAVGAGNCNDDDGFGDTPRQEDANLSNCPGGTVKPNCANDPHVGGEMFMNFMDYSGDGCTSMFTIEQVGRMKASLSPGGDSHTLIQNGILMTWPTSVSTVETSNQFTISPNPSNGQFNIKFLSKQDKLNKITIVNITGKVVAQIATPEQKSVYSVDMTNMPKGIYMVQLAFDNGVIVRKVVLQ